MKLKMSLLKPNPKLNLKPVIAAMWTPTKRHTLYEPIADEAWLTEYYRKREEDEERMKDLELRFKGNKPVTSW